MRKPLFKLTTRLGELTYYVKPESITLSFLELFIKFSGEEIVINHNLDPKITAAINHIVASGIPDNLHIDLTNPQKIVSIFS